MSTYCGKNILKCELNDVAECPIYNWHFVCVCVCVCVQGTAVFWYNLFPSGEGDYSTRHAACPVLLGNKWGECLRHSVLPDFLYALKVSCLF